MHVADSATIREAESRKTKTLEADYGAVDLAMHCNNLKHLDARNILHDSLFKCPELFMGGIGKAKGIKLIHLELKDRVEPHPTKWMFTIPQWIKFVSA
jgi:hypothetical protein